VHLAVLLSAQESPSHPHPHPAQLKTLLMFSLLVVVTVYWWKKVGENATGDKTFAHLGSS